MLGGFFHRCSGEIGSVLLPHLSGEERLGRGIPHAQEVLWQEIKKKKCFYARLLHSLAIEEVL